MRVGVVDIGSSTVRLLVVDRIERGLVTVREERAVLGLGQEIERRGRVSDVGLARAAQRAREYARLARKLGASPLDVIVTAPGRQASNAARLLDAIAVACDHDVRVLSADEEGRLAYAGAVAQHPGLRGAVAVCDVGGGSTEVVVGTPAGGPEWSCSIEVGALRLTSRAGLDDPPGKRSLGAARELVREAFDDALEEFAPGGRLLARPPEVALATGGSARALRRLVGRTLDPDDLAVALRILRKRSAAELEDIFRIDASRARTLAAGALILAEAAGRLGVPLEVARGGLREGAALALLDQLAAA